MTYFEWVNIFEKLKTSPMDYDVLNNLKDKKLNPSQYIHYRFISHVVRTIISRLDIAYKNLVNLIINVDVDVDTLSLELVRYKKELKYIDEILKLPIITEEDNLSIRGNLDNSVDNMYKILREHIEMIDIDGQHISTFDKIMNSSLEE